MTDHASHGGPRPGAGRPPSPTPRDAQIVLRVTRENKSIYVRAAQSGGQTLAAWMLAAADAAISRKKK